MTIKVTEEMRQAGLRELQRELTDDELAALHRAEVENYFDAVERIIGTVTEIVCCYREYSQKIFEIDPAKARTLRAICNAELKNIPNKGTIELPAPSSDLKEIRAVLKQHKATRGYSR